MKIYLSKINESWIVDRVRREWYENNKDISTKYISNADILWIISPWLWKKIPKKHLKQKKVICSQYHFDFSNFDKSDFLNLDRYVDEYHVISKKTESQLKKLTNKKITSIPFWINDKLFFHVQNKKKIRQEFGFQQDDYLVGSFQRDTEGSDLLSPKLIKGPDIFFNIVSKMYEENEKLKIILSGKRRGYLINLFEKNNIPYKYYEMVDQEKLNLLYNLLDLYIVSSRIEGGPQAILESAITKTPILSTDVGVASEILSPESIYSFDNFEKASTDIMYAYNEVQKYKLLNGMELFRDMMRNFYEN